MHKNLSPEINNNLAQSEKDGGVWLKDLEIGDFVLVQTQNSMYRINKTDDVLNSITIEGHAHFCPAAVPVRIAGSTWGGSMLKGSFVGVDMHLEFRVDAFRFPITTSRIQKVDHFQSNGKPAAERKQPQRVGEEVV